MLITFGGCKSGLKDEEFLKIQKKLFELRSFRCTAEIKIMNNKNITQYIVVQYYDHPGKFRIEVVYPEYLKGLVTVSDGRSVAVINPNITVNNTYFVENLLNMSRSSVFLTEFFSNYVKSEKSQMKIENHKYKLITNIFDGNKYYETAILTINPQTGCPEKLEIFDRSGGLRLILIYNEFVINPRLNEQLFKISNYRFNG